MTENQSLDPITVEVAAPARKHWRTALQVPLLLAAAAGLGFAGQQMWQSRHDVQGLLGFTPGKNLPCESAVVVMEGCTASCSTGSCSLAEEGCCAAALLAAEAAAPSDEPVSALSPANQVETL